MYYYIYCYFLFASNMFSIEESQESKNDLINAEEGKTTSLTSYQSVRSRPNACDLWTHGRFSPKISTENQKKIKKQSKLS